MGLRVEIFKHPMYAACSNGGISATHDRATVVNAEGPFEPTPDAPAILIDCHQRGSLRAVPAVLVDGEWLRAPGWHMAGGAYVASSDSRLARLCAALLRDGMRSAIAKTSPDLRKPLTDAINAFPDLAGTFYGAIAFHDRKEG